MDNLESVFTLIERSIGSVKKRHILGGMLMSISLLFGGLATTVVTLKVEDKVYE